MKKKNMYKLIAIAPDGHDIEYVFDNILTALDIKLNIDTARGWKCKLYHKIGDAWIEFQEGFHVKNMKIIINNTGGYKIVAYKNVVTVSRRQRNNWQQTISAVCTTATRIKGACK